MEKEKNKSYGVSKQNLYAYGEKRRLQGITASGYQRLWEHYRTNKPSTIKQTVSTVMWNNME